MQGSEFAGLEPFFARGLPQVERAAERAEERSTEAVPRVEEGRRLVSLEVLAGLSLERLLYYVLVGEGRTTKECAAG